MEKKSFILHLDSLDVFDKLSDEQIGKLLRKMKSYHNGNEYVLDDILVDVLFSQFKNQFDRDNEKFNNVCERNREIANKRWKKSEVPDSTKSTTGKSGVPKSTRNAESDSDSDSDSDKKNNILLFYNNSKNIPIEERTVTQHLIVCFYDLGYKPAKDETQDTIKEWISGIAKVKLKSASQMIDIINSWHAYWKGNKKPVKNHKASLLNHYDLKNDK